MRRCRSRRIFVIALMLARLVSGDFMHLPSAQAATRDAVHPVMMMTPGKPCSEMATADNDKSSVSPHAGHPVPANDGGCCKSSQCACVHASALMGAPQIPLVFNLSYADLPFGPVHRISGPPAVFFRPPIAILH
jgi:hypothetical protein